MELATEVISETKVNTLRNLAELLEKEESLFLFLQELEESSLEEQTKFSLEEENFEELSFVDELDPSQRTCNSWMGISACL